MGKIVLWILLTLAISAKNNTLEQDCLSCHKAQQIPSNLIYRRYLLKYSTSARMQEAMFGYLKDPNKKSSIMPPQFFLKFPMKESLSLEDKRLRQDIKRYLEQFDVRKKLRLEK
ncbi:hypothetical protein MNB_SV-3-359 [hydrothermal vent metagenome]|uniref:Cytochrome c domain-containing protein n=1 Tax=hydrothermal vent metagenome TaxID=652676 RepID=A0A1W1CX74_9ZZZZ